MIHPEWSANLGLSTSTPHCTHSSVPRTEGLPLPTGKPTPTGTRTQACARAHTHTHTHTQTHYTSVSLDNITSSCPQGSPLPPARTRARTHTHTHTHTHILHLSVTGHHHFLLPTQGQPGLGPSGLIVLAEAWPWKRYVVFLSFRFPIRKAEG